MEEKECPSCAMKVDKKAKQCYVCGHEFDNFGTGTKIIAVVLLLSILLWLVL